MPHLVILYTPNLEAEADMSLPGRPKGEYRSARHEGTPMSTLCRVLADTMLAVKDEAGKQVFPTGGVRVLAYPAAHSALADGRGDYAFVYLNLRMARGRSEAVKQAAGAALSATAQAHFAPLLARRALGITLQIDEGPEVFDAKHSSLHPLFSKQA